MRISIRVRHPRTILLMNLQAMRVIKEHILVGLRLILPVHGMGTPTVRTLPPGLQGIRGMQLPHITRDPSAKRWQCPPSMPQSTGEDLGVSARSYLRQVDAWCKVTRTPLSQQALLLYQHLSGRAWAESEELSVDDLAGENGLSINRSWIQERYQEMEVSKIADGLTAFFTRLRRLPGQTIREFNSTFNRSHSRLLEIDCRLPEVAKAWAYLVAEQFRGTSTFGLSR